MFSDSEDYCPVVDSLISEPHLINIKRCSCCLSETCLVQENSTAVPAKSISFLSAGGLTDDLVSVKLEPVNIYDFTPTEQILDSPMAGLDVSPVQPEVGIKNAQIFEKAPLEDGDEGIQEVRVISLFKRLDHHSKPSVKIEDGERKKYARYREKQYICDVCDRSFTLKQNIAQHFFQYHHPRLVSKQRELKEVVSRFCCTKCDRVFTDLEKAKRHEQRVHGDPPKKIVHSCDECNKTFPSPQLLNEHITIIHDHLKPFQCEKCDQSFGRSGGLRRHMLMVHLNKTYTCPYEDCDHPGYKCSKALTAHIRSRHTHERPYECMYCEKRFVRKNDLKVHELTHSTDVIFSCDECGAGFKRESYLRKHKVHCGVVKKEPEVNKPTRSGDLMFRCDKCGANFKREVFFRKHRMHCGLVKEEIKPKTRPVLKKGKAKKNKKA